MQKEIHNIIKFSFEHSTARALLVFSAIFVIFSIGYTNTKEFTPIAFFTFFYAFIAYRLKVISVKEVWGDYAIGDNCGALLYFLIDWLFFIGWIAGSVFLLTDNSLAFPYFKDHSSFILYIMKFSFGSALTFFIWWVGKMFYKKIKHDCEQPKETKYYEVECCCKNCDLDKKVKIPKKTLAVNFSCPECEVVGALRKKKECKD